MRKKEYREQNEQLITLLAVYRDHLSFAQMEIFKQKRRMENEEKAQQIANGLVITDLKNRNNKLLQQIERQRVVSRNLTRECRSVHAYLNEKEIENEKIAEQLDKCIDVNLLKEKIVENREMMSAEEYLYTMKIIKIIEVEYEKQNTISCNTCNGGCPF